LLSFVARLRVLAVNDRSFKWQLKNENSEMENFFVGDWNNASHFLLK